MSGIVKMNGLLCRGWSRPRCGMRPSCRSTFSYTGEADARTAVLAPASEGGTASDRSWANATGEGLGTGGDHSVRILVIEDSRADARLVREMVDEGFTPPDTPLTFCPVCASVRVSPGGPTSLPHQEPGGGLVTLST